jgi:hypothetical protein
LLSTDLQNVNITLRILFRPKVDQLPKMYTNLGIDYDDRVLPSITNEVLKAVVVSVGQGWRDLIVYKLMKPQKCVFAVLQPYLEF